MFWKDELKWLCVRFCDHGDESLDSRRTGELLISKIAGKTQYHGVSQSFSMPASNVKLQTQQHMN
jgi:hypothetical protein